MDELLYFIEVRLNVLPKIPHDIIGPIQETI